MSFRWRRPTSTLLATLAAIALAVGALAAGCSPSPVRGGFDSPNPAAKLYAIERAARENDRAAIPRIIEQLDSEDPAVRFIAIEALYRMTGERHGYDHAAPRHERDAAIRRWVQAYQRSEVGDLRSDVGDQRSAAAPERPSSDLRPAASDNGGLADG